MGMVATELHAGACHLEPTTVIDMSHGGAEVIRQGRGELSALGLG